MKQFIILLFFLPPTFLMANANDSCSIVKSSNIAFTGDEPVDNLELAYSGASCKDAKLILSIYKADGEKIYTYTYEYKAGFYNYDSPSYQSDINVYMKQMLGYLVGNTSSLPERTECSDKNSQCEKGYFPNRDIEYESTVSLVRYNNLKAQPVAAITHSVGREAWVTIIFDKTSAKVIEVLLAYV